MGNWIRKTLNIWWLWIDWIKKTQNTLIYIREYLNLFVFSHPGEGYGMEGNTCGRIVVYQGY